MDIFIVFLLLCGIGLLIYLIVKFSKIESYIQLTERNILQYASDESIIEIVSMLRAEGVSEELIVLVQERSFDSRVLNMLSASELIKGAEELLSRQDETGEDHSESISTLLKLAKLCR